MAGVLEVRLRAFLWLAIIALVLGVLSPLIAAIPAFPGADGAGSLATGGRGGIVYHVTTLDEHMTDNRPGTLRYGLNDANFMDGGVPLHRTIVFDVGGTIWLGRNASDTEGWDSQAPMNVGSNVTVAGQTAPGGIYIMGSGLKANKPNEIIRNLFIAPGYGTRSVNSTTGYADQYTFDAMNIAADTVMVDHITAVFATDETISADERAKNVTVQFSNISQGQNYPQIDSDGSYTGHAFGSLLQEGTNAKISIIHNLYAHQKGRLPRVGTPADKLTDPMQGPIHDFRNNVFYNWISTAGTGGTGQRSSNNFIGNFYLAGAGGDNANGTAIINTAGGTTAFDGTSSLVTKAYVAGNLKDVNKDGDPNDGVSMTAGPGSGVDFRSVAVQAGPFTDVPYYGLTDTATGAFDRVLNYVGANWNNRHPIDARIVNEVRTVTGKIMAFNDPNNGTEWNSLLALKPVGGVAPYNRPAGFDTDQDGMPNEWELLHELDPNVADNNGDFDADGYTNLEEYLNDLGAFPAPAPLVFHNGDGDGRYARIGNWTIPGQEDPTHSVWQPSRYDEAQVNSGTVTVDSVGQHAGVLKIATNDGDTARLDITGGWIRAETSVVIGDTPSAAGELHLSGGSLSTPLLTKGDAGTFELTGGTLHAGVVTFDVLNQGGTIAPGNSIGNTHIQGNLIIEDGALEIEVASPFSSEPSDTLLVDGLLSLAGGLEVKPLGYQPAVGDFWLIAAADEIEGEFLSVTEGYEVQQLDNMLFLVSSVPEPGSLVLLSIGGAAMLAVGHRRRHAARR